MHQFFGKRAELRLACGGGIVLLLSAVFVARAWTSGSLFGSSVPSFARLQSYATGRFPVSLAASDLDGDGRTDIAAANLDANTVSVLLNRGDGKLRARRDYRTGARPASVAIGDLNGDGRADLVSANYRANTVSVLLNKGGGRLRPKQDFRTGDGPGSVAVGDLNGDGQADVVSANSQGTVSVFLNRSGSLQAKRDYAASSTPAFVAIGDLNGDGAPDLVIANGGGNSVSVLLNQDDGSFRPKVDYETRIEPDSVAIGDLDRDGQADVAVANTGADEAPDEQPAGTISVLLGHGDGTLELQGSEPTGSIDPHSVTIADLNGDHRADLAVANGLEGALGGGRTGTVSVLLNRGHANFQPALFYPTGSHPASLGDKALAVGDLNGDDKPDMATVDVRANRTSVLLASATVACTVPNVTGKSLPAATEAIVQGHCRVGKPGHTHSVTVSKGRIIAQSPLARTVLPTGGKVDLVVSLGAR